VCVRNAQTVIYIHNIGIFVNISTCFFMKIVAINIFTVNNFHLLITISLAKYVILRKQVFNQIFGVTLMQSMLNIYKRKDEKNLGIVNNTKLYTKLASRSVKI
jgi:hypothetical protein